MWNPWSITDGEILGFEFPLAPTISFFSTVLRVFLLFPEGGRVVRGIAPDIAEYNYKSTTSPYKMRNSSLHAVSKLFIKARIFVRRPGVVKESDNLSLDYPRGEALHNSK